MKLLLLIILPITFVTNLFSVPSYASLIQPINHTQLETPLSDNIVIIPRLALKSLDENLTKANSKITYKRVYNIRATDEFAEGYFYWRDSYWHPVEVPVDFSQNIIIDIIKQGDAKFTYITADRKEVCITFSDAAIEEIFEGADVYEVMGKLIDAQVYLDPSLAATQSVTSAVKTESFQFNTKTIWLVVGAVVGCVAIGITLRFLLNRNKEKDIDDIDFELPVVKETTSKPVSDVSSEDKSTSYYNVDAISSDTEARILAALVKLEQTTFFLNPDITLARMSARMETNTKYLSHVIHAHRGKAIPTYINNLRINYVVNKLKEDLVFRKYKISHLAALSGFSSHSKFSSEFKRVVGKSPSKFISKLNANASD